MPAPIFNMNNYARSTSERYSDEAYVDPSLCSLRGYRTSADFWDPYTNEAMTIHNEKFRIYNHQAQRAAASVPILETPYEDHFTAGSRQPRIPAAKVNTPMGQHLQPDPLELRVPEIPVRAWMILMLLILVCCT